MPASEVDIRADPIASVTTVGWSCAVVLEPEVYEDVIDEIKMLRDLALSRGAGRSRPDARTPSGTSR